MYFYKYMVFKYKGKTYRSLENWKSIEGLNDDVIKRRLSYESIIEVST